MARERPLRDHFFPTYTFSSCIQLPEVTVDHYEIEPSTIQSLPSFLGLDDENPYKLLDEFLKICSTIEIQGFTEDDLRLRLFPFTLKDKAKRWFYCLSPNTITSWDQMQQTFLKRYFPKSKTIQIRRAIMGFSQYEGEQFYETWKRLKDLLKICPHHDIPKCQLVQYFYDGLTEPHQQMVDASCGGTIMMKTENEAWTLFETLSENYVQHASISKMKQILQAIMGFSQYEGEQFYEAWERLMDLLRMCPDHAIPKWRLVLCFYGGLTEPHRQMVDTSCGGTIMMKNEEEAWTLIEKLSENSEQHASFRTPVSRAPKSEGLCQLGNMTDVIAKLDALSQKLDQIMAVGSTPSHHPSRPHEACSLVQFSELSHEQVNSTFSRSNNDPYSNSYNSEWRNHPNLSDVTAKVDALSQKLDQVIAVGSTPCNHPSTPHEACSFCFSPLHHENDCPTLGQFSKLSHEQVNSTFARSGNDPYSNSYNLEWRNHPNFSWRGEALGNLARPHGLHNQAHSQPFNQSFNPSPNYRPPQQQYQLEPPISQLSSSSTTIPT
ncbi:uncharacterized protein LOC132192202 [Corylus avellana]|uniref:uncharacterized protein LOC132192202 n=1 Tax=Corylus avellana TaxID=13451 RepID=UPI00286B94A7|nr:uncharacterized protein LOC132192202 [Corylus avellana]XP_059463452.1 uncharacterized protein LOC132192202 [Corylus avellana]